MLYLGGPHAVMDLSPEEQASAIGWALERTDPKRYKHPSLMPKTIHQDLAHNAERANLSKAKGRRRR